MYFYYNKFLCLKPFICNAYIGLLCLKNVQKPYLRSRAFVHGDLRRPTRSLLLFSHITIEKKVNKYKAFFIRKKLKLRGSCWKSLYRKHPPPLNHCRVSDARVGYRLVLSPLQTTGSGCTPPSNLAAWNEIRLCCCYWPGS